MEKLENQNKESKAQQKKEPPKKIDLNKYKLLIGERLIGQVMKKPNELQKNKEKQNEQKNIINENTSCIKENDNIKIDETVAYENSIKEQKKIASSNVRKSLKQSSTPYNLGFDLLPDFANDTRLKSSNIIIKDNPLTELILESKNYEEYLSELKQKGIKESTRETFCEGFFIASFPKKDGKVINNSEEKLLASCGHEECSKLPSMKPEIIMRYPLKDTKNLELNNLAATICFPTGIKCCYSEKSYPKIVEDYVTQITNQKGERYYMRTFHFYHKMLGIEFTKEYEMHPLKHQLMIFSDKYTVLSESEFTEEITNDIQNNLACFQELGFREYVYIPYCLCLISKYSYTKELESSLKTIYRIMAKDPKELYFDINELIMYLIHSIPIPIKHMRVKFYIPYTKEKMELLCPKIDDVSMSSKLTILFRYLSVDNIILIFRLLLSERKILFIHDDYTELTSYTDSFISLLYPFKWVHTYIPIMSDQMLKYLQTFLPFLNGIHSSLMKFVEDVFKGGEIEESDEVFLIYIRKNKIDLSSSLNKKRGKTKFSKYVQYNVLPLPFEKDLKKELKLIESSLKSIKKDSKSYNKEISLLEARMRDAFVDGFVKIFSDYEKYIGILDDDVIFNKVLFMNNITKDKTFYDEFIDCQLFQQFTQNILKNECSYFNNKIKEAKEKENLKKDKKNKKKVHRESMNLKDNVYIVKPDYLGIKENDENLIEKALEEDYKIEKLDKEKRNRILEKIYPIEPEKYINSKCIIYLTPEKKEIKNEEDNKNKLMPMKEATILKKIRFPSSILAENELTEKQKDQIKDDIKDIVIKIFKSQIKEDTKALKNEIFRLLDKSFGREFFISLISNNNNNIISLQEYSFNFLLTIIKGTLNTILKLEETEKIIEEIIILIKSTKFFQKEVKKEKGLKSTTKKQVTIYEIMKKEIQDYSKITQTNLWKKWYEQELKKEEEQEDNNTKEKILIKICLEMIDLEIPKTTVKNIIDNINKTIYENEKDFKMLQNKYLQIITTSQYISTAKT